MTEQLSEIEIFNKKFYEILISDHDNQINFLKIYPLFKKDQNIIILWKEYYLKLHEFKSVENQINMESLIEFLTFALEHDLVEYKTTEILSILTMMDNFNDVANRDLIKSCIIKGKTNKCLKKISLIDDPNIYNANTNANANVNGNGNTNFGLNLIEMSPNEIAQELTRKFAYLVEKITHHELLFVALHDNKYSKNENELITPIELLINDFHKLSYIIFYTILIENKNDIARIKTIKHILKICEELKNLHNYHALFGLVAALNNSTIQRLDTLWKNKKYNNILADLTEIINPCNNYRNYRNLIKKNIKTNIVPYIGLAICDIKHALECPLYDIPNNNFNMDVYEVVLSILNNFKSIQLNYTIPKNDKIYKWLSNINIFYTESQFYDMSISLKTNIHKQLIEQLNSDDKIKQEIPRIEITESENISYDMPKLSETNRSHDSIDEIIKMTNIPQNNKRKKHRSMPAKIKKYTDPLSELKTWSVSDVQEWLCINHMEIYCDVFREEEIDGMALANLTNDYLKNDLGVTKLGHRLKILDAIRMIGII